MAIYKTKTGYRVQVDVGKKYDGGRDRLTDTCKTKKEAERREAEFNIIKMQNNGKSTRITFGEFVEKIYWPDKVGTLRANTIRGYDRDIRLRLIPQFGNILVGDINRLHVQRMISTCPTYKVAKNARDTLRQILNEALQLEVITHNPAAGRFKFPEKIQDRRRNTAVWLTSFSEHKDVLEKAKGDPVELVLILGLCFGLRKGEVFGLDWQDVDFKRKQITIRQTYTYSKGDPDLTPPKTSKSFRTIPMPDYAFLRLKQLQGGVRHVSGPVVVDKGARMNPQKGQRLMTKFREAHDVPNITIMSLRHSFATAAIRSGMDVASVSKWLGHEDVQTTLNRYVRPLLSNLQEDVAIINAGYYGERLSAKMAQNGTDK